MNRSAFIPLTALLATGVGVTACEGPHIDGGGTVKVAGKAKAGPSKVDPARVISGVVTVPDGVDLAGAQAVACLTPRETCAQEAQADVPVVDGVGQYRLIVPVSGDYHIMVWKDVDGDGAATTGDILAFANDMKAVPSGQRLTPMAAFVRADGEMINNPGGAPMGTEAELATAATAARAAGVAGRWSQSSSGTELVWGPEIKIQPAISTSGFGTNLGGTFGGGSPTNTTIVYSYKPVQIRRAMTLDIRPDGAFHWVATQERRQGECRAMRQEKFGRVAIEGDQLTFVVTDARQSCGGGRVKSFEPKPETFTLARAGGGFRLTADKGVNWSFSPAG